ncbi:MAG: GntR family transcriptional regulator [Pseudomonadota bacterium]
MSDAEYQRIARRMALELRGGDFASGTALPAERRLMQRYGCGRNTLRRALALLENEGLIDRGQGRVARVTRNTLTKTLSDLADFHSYARARGVTPRTDVLAFEPSKGTLQTDLHFPAGESPWCLRRRRAIDRQVVVYQEAWLPAEVGRVLRRADLHDDSLYRLLGARLGWAVTGARDTVSAGHAPPAVHDAFGPAGPDVVVQADRQAWLADGRVVELSCSYVRPEFFRFSASTGELPE